METDDDEKDMSGLDGGVAGGSGWSGWTGAKRFGWTYGLPDWVRIKQDERQCGTSWNRAEFRS
jgi:hypothetical protein